MSTLSLAGTLKVTACWAFGSLHDLPTSNDPPCVLAYSAPGATGLPVTVTPIPSSGSLVGSLHATPRRAGSWAARCAVPKAR